MRYIDLDLTTRFVPDNPQFAPRTLDVGDSYVDFLLGARYTWALSDRWSLTLRGDGSTGDSMISGAEGKALLKKWGVEGDYVGVGNCVIGYPDETPEMKPRKENYVHYVL